MTFLFHISTFLYLDNCSFSIVQSSPLTDGGERPGQAGVSGDTDGTQLSPVPVQSEHCRVPALHRGCSANNHSPADIAAGTWNCSSWRLTFAREKESPGVETIFIFLSVKYGAGWEKERWGVRAEGAAWGFQVGPSLEPLLAQHTARAGPDWEVLRSGDFNLQLNWKLLGLLSHRDNDTAVHRQQTIASLSI